MIRRKLADVPAISHGNMVLKRNKELVRSRLTAHDFSYFPRYLDVDDQGFGIIESGSWFREISPDLALIRPHRESKCC